MNQRRIIHRLLEATQHSGFRTHQVVDHKIMHNNIHASRDTKNDKIMLKKIGVSLDQFSIALGETLLKQGRDLERQSTGPRQLMLIFNGFYRE